MPKSKTRIKQYAKMRVAVVECASLPTINGDAELPTAQITGYTGEPMQLEGFQLPVVIDIDSLVIPEQSTAILLNHDPDQIVGHSTDIKKEDFKVQIEAALSFPGKARDHVVQSAKNGFPWGSSITVDFGKVKKVSRNAVVNVNGRQYNGPLNVLYNSRLRETSFVPVGGDINATAAVSAQLGTTVEESDMTFEEFAASLGVSLEGISEEDLAKMQAGFDAIFGDAPAEEAPAEAEAEAETEGKEEKEEEAEAEPAAASAAVRPTLSARIASTQSRLNAIRSGSGRPPAPRSISARPDVNRIVACAIGSTYGIDGATLESEYTADEMTEATSRGMRGYGIKRLFAETLSASGRGVSAHSFGPEQVQEVFAMGSRGLFSPTAKASGFTTLSLPTILGEVANKKLLQDFGMRESIAVKLMAETSVTNYQKFTSARLTFGGELEEVGPGGEIKHATMSEETYENQAKLLAKMLQLTEQDVVNDEMGAFLSNAARFSRMAFNTRELIFWRLLLANTGTFFGSGNNNKATTALSIASLTELRTLMRKQTDSDDIALDTIPKFLVVPVELSDTGDSLVKTVTVNETTTTDTPKTDSNPHVGKYEVLDTANLSNETITNFSATGHYLFADPNDIPAFEIAYLNGQKTPVIETETAAFNQFGMQMRVSWRFGIAQVDFRGAVFSDGTT
jgi:hypothetical protein